MALPCLLRRLLSVAGLLVPGVAAADLTRRGTRQSANAGLGQAKGTKKTRVKGHLVSDPEPTVLDFSNQPFTDFTRSAAVHLAAADPYKANPKNGTPWFRYTKTAGRGQANHSHFGGLTATGDFPEDILHAHNVVRERAGVKPLQWNTRLAEMSSARVLKLANEGCYIQHSPLKDRWYEAGFEYIGENLYKVINMKPTGVDIVDAWYAEIEDYTYGPVGTPCVKERCAGRTSPPCTLGHFTQVMWSESTDVGCARAECPDQAKRTFVSVCNYGPGGNIVGRYPFPAVNSGSMGLATQDCRMRPRPQPSMWEEVKEGKLPSKLRGNARRKASVFLSMVLAVCALTSAVRLGF